MFNNFSKWMYKNSHLSESSIYRYTRGVNTISNEMQYAHIINKSLFDMNIVELDISIANILINKEFEKKDSKGNRMYSNALKQYRFYVLDTYDNDSVIDNIVDEINNSDIPETEKESIIKSRKGQGLYREKLLKKYDSKCVVTGIDNTKLLMASHIKPWAISNNLDRIDVENGLLLSPNMDKLFDCKLITFTPSGKMIVSSFIGKENENKLHIDKQITVDLKATNKLLEYLEYHRDVLFVK